jgi:hypothetical protein
VRCGKRTVTGARVESRNDCDASIECGIEQSLQEAIARPPDTQVDYRCVLLESELQRLRESEAAARGLGLAPLAFPARAQHEQARIGRDAGDADAVVGACSDDSRDRRAVSLRHCRTPIDKISPLRDLPDEIGVIDLDAGVDFGDPHSLSGRDLVQIRQVPQRRARLDRIERVAVRQNLEQVDLLRRLDPRVRRQRLDQLRQRYAVGRMHYEAVDSQRRHRPALEDPEPILACECSRDPIPGILSRPRSVVLRITRVGTKMWRGHAQHH